MMAVNWAERISAFSRSPSRFLSGTTAEAFLAELLRELRDDRATYSVKVQKQQQTVHMWWLLVHKVNLFEFWTVGQMK